MYRLKEAHEAVGSVFQTTMNSLDKLGIGSVLVVQRRVLKHTGIDIDTSDTV